MTSLRQDVRHEDSVMTSIADLIRMGEQQVKKNQEIESQKKKRELESRKEAENLLFQQEQERIRTHEERMRQEAQQRRLEEIKAEAVRAAELATANRRVEMQAAEREIQLNQAHEVALLRLSNEASLQNARRWAVLGMGTAAVTLISLVSVYAFKLRPDAERAVQAATMLAQERAEEGKRLGAELDRGRARVDGLMLEVASVRGSFQGAEQRARECESKREDRGTTGAGGTKQVKPPPSEFTGDCKVKGDPLCGQLK